jgi:hypothetical protein
LTKIATQETEFPFPGPAYHGFYGQTAGAFESGDEVTVFRKDNSSSPDGSSLYITVTELPLQE